MQAIVIERRQQEEESIQLDLTAAELEQKLRDLGAKIVHPAALPQDPVALLNGKAVAFWVEV